MRDDEGAEFDSLDAAVHAAARAAAGIGQGRLARGETSDVVIEVRDERSQRVCTIRASMESTGTSHGLRGRILGAPRGASQPMSKGTRRRAEFVSMGQSGASKGLLMNA